MSKSLFTFASSHMAMEAELLCEDNALPCRLIPLPSRISAGCGLALLCSEDLMERVKTMLSATGVHVEGVYLGEGKNWVQE